MEFNDSNSIFQNEYKILENASNVLRDEDFKENPIRKQYEELLTGYKKLLQQSVRIVNISDKQQNFLYKLQSDLKNILDNTEQGIFTVNLDLIVNRGCSAECKRIFGQNIEGGNLISLIKPYNDSEKIKLIESILNKDFFDGDGLNRQVMLMLLPNELKVGERVYGVSYKPVNFDFKEQVENAFMIVMTDITEKKSIKSKMEEEQIIFKCITRIISDIKTFSMCIREYRNFYSVKLPEIINNSRKNVFDILNELFRTVHTLKGNFAIFEITWLVEFLDDVEQKMFLMRENHENLTIQDIKNALNSYDFDFALTNALNRLKAIIGNKWILDQEFAVIDIQELKAAEKKAAEFSRELEETLKKMRYSSLCEMLSIYPEYVQRLAGRLEKSIVPFNIECSQDIRVDAEKNEEFIRSLVHVFRNAVDHGIESYEERAAQNKEMDGRICCSVQKVNHGFKILISDDGRGIDAEAVKQAALKNQLITRQEAENTSLEDSVMLIFKDGVTTAAGNKGLSGRGEGLASVKMQTELLGGTVEVNSKPGRGTVFVFNIPEQD